MDGDYLSAYRRYLENFVNNLGEDQLPVKTPCYDVTEEELAGEVANMTLDFLDQE